MLPTYQKEGENESLLIPQTVSLMEETQPGGFWTKTNKTRAGVVMVVGMIVAAFAVRSELFPQKSVVYSPSVDGVMQSSSPGLMGSSSPVYVDPSSAVIDTENVMIAGNPLPGVTTQHPESAESTTGIMTSGSDLSGTNTGATLIQKVAAAAEVETTATTTTTTTTTTPVVATAPAVGVDPNAPIPRTIILGDPNHPAPAKTVPVVPITEAADTTKPVNDIANIKSDTRLSPLFMSSHTDTNGMLRTFFSKYGFVGNRLTDKEKYHIPTAVQTAEVTGDAAIWAYATMTTGISTSKSSN